MKFLVVLTVAVACASAATDESNAAVVKSTYDLTPEGAFQFAYETANGIFGQASGSVKNQNSEYPSLEVAGAYKYTGPDGVPVELTYTADENGFQPQGSHLPVPPPTPEAILRGLAYIAANPPAPEGVARATGPKPAYG